MEQIFIKTRIITTKSNLNNLIEPNFQGINRLFVLAFENDVHKISSKRHNFPSVEIKDYNVMIDGKNFFDQPIKNDKTTSEKTTLEKLLQVKEMITQLVVY